MKDVSRSLGGRIRRFGAGDDLPARLASPVQATEADGVKRAMIALAGELPKLCARLVLVAYDAVLVEAPMGNESAVSELVAECLKAGLEYYLKRVPVVVDVDVRRSWGM
jgi:DNA polymerase I-like protein with 3'-5' exonuclease and polymerase domains